MLIRERPLPCSEKIRERLGDAHTPCACAHKYKDNEKKNSANAHLRILLLGFRGTNVSIENMREKSTAHNDGDGSEVYHLIEGKGVVARSHELFSDLLGDDRAFATEFIIRLARFLTRSAERALGIRYLAPMLRKDFPDDIIKIWRILLEEKIILSVVRLPRFRDLPKLFSFSIRLAELKSMTDGHTRFLIANIGGADFISKADALMRAFAEAVERYVYLIYRQNDLVFGKYAELKNKAVNPRAFLLSRYDYESLKANLEVEQIPFGWTNVECYPSGTTTLIPAQLVFWNYHRPSDEPLLRESNTNGAAAHQTENLAIQSAVLELIERDAFMNAWFAGVAPEHIELDSLPIALRREAAIDELTHSSLQLVLLIIPTDFKVPVVSAVIIDGKGLGPGVCFSAASGLNLGETIVKTIREVLTVYTVERNRKVEKTKIMSFDILDNLSQSDFESLSFAGRMELFWPKKIPSWLTFFLGGVQQTYMEIERESAPLEIEDVINCFKDFEYRIFVHRAKTEFLRHIGLHAIKVIVPELQPLYLDQKRRGYNPRRLQEYCERLKIQIPKSVNLYPHPFP